MQNRTAGSRLGVLWVVAGLFSCGGVTEKTATDMSADTNPVVSTCKKSCAVTSSHPCFGKKYKNKPIEQGCEEECQSRVQAVASNPGFQAGCGMCVAAGVTYVYKTDPPCDKNPKDPSCWCAPKFPNPKVECVKQCFSPDAGPGY